jgi:hypothetical protein
MNGRELTQLFQGLELVVAAQLEKRGPATHHGAFTQGSKLLNKSYRSSSLSWFHRVDRVLVPNENYPEKMKNKLM